MKGVKAGIKFMHTEQCIGTAVGAMLVAGCFGLTVSCHGQPPQTVTSVPVAAKEPNLALVRINPSEGPQVPMPKGLAALVNELQRAKRELNQPSSGTADSAQKGDAYYIGYEVFDLNARRFGATNGALTALDIARIRMLSADVRVGSYLLDSTHPLDDARGGFSFSIPELVALDPEDDNSIAGQAFRATNRAYRAAAEHYQAVRASNNIKVDIEDKTGDFTQEPATKYLGPRAELAKLDMPAWQDRLRRLSANFVKNSLVHQSSVFFEETAQNRWVVNSEGTVVQTGEPLLRVTLNAETKAEDGMDLSRTEIFSSRNIEGLPSESELEKVANQIMSDLASLRSAPLAEPYVGPAILLGRASAVMFHEIFGHRVEGERQKQEDEGQTFAKKIGETITSEFVDIFDDPTVTKLSGIDLMGSYRFDDEGVPAQRAQLISNGKLEGFLMSRVPVRGIQKSNGHGRRALGFGAAQARQSNLVIESHQAITMRELREKLVVEAKRQNRRYGLLFADIVGGYTQTSRHTTQGYKVSPVLVYRIWVDGRPDELIRGVDIVGTPLTGLTKILAASDDYAAFNGVCGAESGWVSVSAVSPSLLIGQIEVALRDKSNVRPPILSAPQAEASPEGKAQ